MSKKYTEQLMKFEVTKDKLKMEITLKDLAWLFKNSPNNYGCDGEGIAKVKRDKYKQFAKYIVNMLMAYENSDSNETRWGKPFEDIFESIFEGYEDEFINYPNLNKN